MGFFSAALVSSSGMSVQRQVMDIISENLANVNTSKSDDGGPYRRKVPVIGSKQVSDFSDVLGQQISNVAYISDILHDNTPPRLDYDPTHPLADKNGYVKKPNINVALEMVHMMDATRAYEANVEAFNASKSMASKALQIGA